MKLPWVLVAILSIAAVAGGVGIYLQRREMVQRAKALPDQLAQAQAMGAKNANAARTNAKIDRQ